MLSKCKLGVLIAIFSVAALTVFAQVNVGYVNIVNISDCDFTVTGSTENCPSCDPCGQTCQSGCGTCKTDVNTITNYCLVQDVKGNVSVTLNSAEIDADNDGDIDYVFPGTSAKAKLKIKGTKSCVNCQTVNNEAIYLSFKTKLTDPCSRKKVGEVKTSMVITYLWAGQDFCSQYAISVVEEFNMNIKSSCANPCGYKNKFRVCDLIIADIPHGVTYNVGCWSGDICGKGAKASGTVLIAETWTEDAKVTSAWNGRKGKFNLKSKNLTINYNATAASGCGECGCGTLKGNAKVGYGTTNLIKDPADWCEMLTECDVLELLIPTETDCCNQCNNECNPCNNCGLCNNCGS